MTTFVKLRDRQVFPAPLLRSFGALAVKLGDHEVCGRLTSATGLTGVYGLKAKTAEATNARLQDITSQTLRNSEWSPAFSLMAELSYKENSVSSAENGVSSTAHPSPTTTMATHGLNGCGRLSSKTRARCYNTATYQTSTGIGLFNTLHTYTTAPLGACLSTQTANQRQR